MPGEGTVPGFGFFRNHVQRTRNHGGDFRFKIGTHALYKAGPGIGILRELGVPFSGGSPAESAAYGQGCMSAVAKLAAPGGTTIQVAKYLVPGRATEPKADERELEALLDLVQPGRRDAVVLYRLGRMRKRWVGERYVRSLCF